MALACFGKQAEYHFNKGAIHIDQDEINSHCTNYYLVVHFDAVDGWGINDVKPHLSYGFMWNLVKAEETIIRLEGAEDFENVDWAFYYDYAPLGPMKKSLAARVDGADEGVSFSPLYWRKPAPGEETYQHPLARIRTPMSFSFVGNGPVEWVEKNTVSIAKGMADEEEDEEEPKPVYETLPNGRKVQVIGYSRYVVNDDLTPVTPQIEVLPNGVAVRVSSSGRRIRVDIDTLEDIDREPPKRNTVKKSQKKQPEPPKRIFRPGRSKLKE